MTKKILRIITRLNIGGPAIHVTNLNYYLDRVYDCQSLLVYGALAEGEGSMEYLAEQKQLRTICLPELGREISLVKDLLIIWKLYRLIKQESPDIVHTHTAKAGLAGRIAARLAGVPTIFHTFHGHVFHSYFGSWKTKFFIYLEKLLALGTTAIIAISAKQKTELVSYGIAPAEKIRVINLGFELAKLLNTPKKNSWKRKYEIEPGTKLVGIVGRLVPIKNHDYFLEIASQVVGRMENVVFLIIGDGELKADLENKIQRMGLQNRVIITGFIQDSVDIYSELDLVVLTSHNEGTPVTLIEALAFGKPVAATKVGGVEDILNQGEFGWLEELNNSKKFAQDIMHILMNYEEARHKAKRGQYFVLENYDIKSLIEKLGSLYQLNSKVNLFGQ